MSGIGPGAGFDRMLNGSVGMQVNRMLDALGLPDKVGDLIGAQIDAQRGDVRGMMRNLADLNSGLGTGTMDKLFGKGLPPAGFVPRPPLFGGLVGGALGGIGQMLRPQTLTPMGFKPVGLSREAPFGTGLVGRSMEQAIRSNPFVKAQMEQQLGGRILLDGRNDGKITVWRPPFPNVGGIMRNALTQGLMPRIGIAAALGGMAIPMAGALAANAVGRTLLGSLQRLEGNITGFMRGMTGTNAAGGAQPGQAVEHRKDPSLAPFADSMGIDLRSASFEDVLFLMLMKYAKTKEADVMKKVEDLNKSIKDKEDGKTGNSTDGAGGTQKAGGAGKSGGLLGGLLGGIGNMVMPGVGGFLGRSVGGIADGVMGTGGSQGPNNASGQSNTDRMGGGDGSMTGGELGQEMDPSKMSDTMKQQMLQKLMQDLQKTYEMLTNMMKSMHDMQMKAVGNLR